MAYNYNWCETCGRLIGGEYDDPNDCCTAEPVKEAVVEEVVEKVEKPKKKTTPKKKAAKKA